MPQNVFGSGARAGLIEALKFSANLPAGVPKIRTMVSPPTVTKSASATLPRKYFAGASSTSTKTHSAVYGGALTISGSYAVEGKYGASVINTVTASAGSAEPDATSSVRVSFLHEGTSFELQITSETGGFVVLIDDEFVSLTPETRDGNSFIKYTFPERSTRRVDVYGKMSFIGVSADESDLVVAAPRRGPRAILVGDSFTSSAADGWPCWFAALLGWDDVWVSGIGGSGYANNGSGTKPTFNERAYQDVAQFDPDVVIALGSINDASRDPAVVRKAADEFVVTIKRHCPDCVVVGGYNATGDIGKMTANGLAVMDATRDAFLSNGATWLNPVELPIAFSTSQGNWTTARMAHSAGRTGAQGLWINSSTTENSNVRIGSTVELGEGDNRERVVITGVGASGGTQVLYFEGSLQYAHEVGEVIREVGPSYITGFGNEGSPTGSGNADLYVSSDGVHPNAVGARAYAFVVASLLNGHLHSLI